MKPYIVVSPSGDVKIEHHGRENLLEIRDYLLFIGYSLRDLNLDFMGDPRNDNYNEDIQNYWWIHKSCIEDVEEAIKILWEDVYSTSPVQNVEK